MIIKIMGIEINTSDDTITWDPLLQEAVDHIKANESSFTEGESFQDIQEVKERGS